MESQEQVQQKQKDRNGSCKTQNRDSYDYKLKAVKLFDEEHYTARFIVEQLGIGLS